MNQLYTTHHENIVMKREPRHMADTVSYMLAGELCTILDWSPEHVDQRARLNENFVRIKLQHDGYEWHVLAWQLQESNGIYSLQDQATLPLDKSWIIIASHEYLWAPYLRWGRMSTWIDCSWLSQQIYAKCGVQLLRDAKQQVTQWQSVRYDDLQSWDLIFFEEVIWSGNIKHVWIFIEEWKILHASEQWTANVRIDTLDPRWIINKHGEVANHFAAARRYI